ncbi:MAG: glycosyltransferase [Prevotellaceae bacterium]|jgi:glycosyltransferase involved in cell wall biosynthesis|nr:glycosyltransferase [Prevotellaceae bacterium]
MKICFITTGDICQIATMKRATGMAEPLIRASHEVAIAALDCANNRERFRLECPNAVPLFFNQGNQISEIRQKNKLIKAWKPDMVYVCAFTFRNFPLKTKQTKYFVEHSELRSAIPDNKGAKRYLDMLLENLSVSLFDGQICASRYLEKYFRQKIEKHSLRKPVLYSPYAYNPAIMFAQNPLFDSLKEKYAGKKIILYMGTLTLNYGFGDILKAVELLKTDRKDFVLLLMGKEKHKNYVNNFINENDLNGFVDYPGYVAENDLSSYFCIADAFVSPINNTIQDIARCPSKLFMYLPFEKPTVTCKIGEAKELFGDKGYYYQPNNTKQFAEVLNDAIDTATLKYNINVEKHSWEYRTTEFLNWIKENYNLQ